MRGRSGFGWSQFIMGHLPDPAGGVHLYEAPAAYSPASLCCTAWRRVITGICDIILYIKEERFTGFGPAVSLVSGILSIMTGIVLLAFPGIAEWIVALLFPLWFITHCISRLTHTGLIRFMAGEFYYWFTMIVNILGLVLGFLMLCSNPSSPSSRWDIWWPSA